MKDLTLGKIGGWLIGLIALGATSSRTIHFLNSILPSSEQYLAWLAVAILDFGLLFWLNIYLTGSRGQSQRAISMGMIIVSGCGISLTTAGDMFLLFEGSAAKNSTWGLLALCSVLALLIANVAAKVAMSIANPEHQRRAAESELADSIEDEAIVQMRFAIPAVSKELAAAKVNAQLAAIRNATLASLPAGSYTPALPTIEQAAPVAIPIAAQPATSQPANSYPTVPNNPEGHQPINPEILFKLLQNYIGGAVVAADQPAAAPGQVAPTPQPQPTGKPTFAADSGSDNPTADLNPKNS